MPRKDLLVPLVAIVVISVPITIFSYFKSTHEKQERLKESVKKDVREWGEIKLLNYGDIGLVEERCKKRDKLVNNKEIVSNFTGGEEVALIESLNKICSSLKEITRGTEKRLDEIKDNKIIAENKMRELKSRINNMRGRDINVLNKIRSIKGNILYVITIPATNEHGVVDLQKSDINNLYAGYSKEVMIESNGVTRVVGGGGEVIESDEYNIYTHSKVETFNKKIRNFEDKISNIEEEISKLKLENYNILKKEISKNISTVKRIVE